MGCINSRRIKRDINNDNLVIKARLLQGGGTNGYLELNCSAITFTTPYHKYNWALQHLRRYGLNGSIFSFEAGRRCESGPGIYTFQCIQAADRFYQVFQRYINDVSLLIDDTFAVAEYGRDHPSHAFGRPDFALTNNYLEPAPTSRLIGTIASTEFEIDSPNALQTVTLADNLTNQNRASSTLNAQTSTNLNISSSSGGNVYLDQPLSSQLAQAHSGLNTNNGGQVLHPINSPSINDPITIFKNKTPSESHMYENVESFEPTNRLQETNDNKLDQLERCYENLSPLDCSTLLSQRSTIQKQLHQAAAIDKSANEGVVNYIVLDLDHVRSPTSSPNECFGSGLSIELLDRLDNGDDNRQQAVPVLSVTTPTSLHPAETIGTSSQGYSTIDFIKTCALIKSSATCGDFDAEHEHDQEESRITRHSKCVRKAYSMSE